MLQVRAGLFISKLNTEHCVTLSSRIGVWLIYKTTASLRSVWKVTARLLGRSISNDVHVAGPGSVKALCFRLCEIKIEGR